MDHAHILTSSLSYLCISLHALAPPHTPVITKESHVGLISFVNCETIYRALLNHLECPSLIFSDLSHFRNYHTKANYILPTAVLSQLGSSVPEKARVSPAVAKAGRTSCLGSLYSSRPQCPIGSSALSNPL